MQPKYFKENSVDFSVYWHQWHKRKIGCYVVCIFFFFYLREKELPRRPTKEFLIYATVLVTMQFLGHIVT